MLIQQFGYNILINNARVLKMLIFNPNLLVNNEFLLSSRQPEKNLSSSKNALKHSINSKLKCIVDSYKATMYLFSP